MAFRDYHWTPAFGLDQRLMLLDRWLLSQRARNMKVTPIIGSSLLVRLSASGRQPCRFFLTTDHNLG